MRESDKEARHLRLVYARAAQDPIPADTADDGSPARIDDTLLRGAYLSQRPGRLGQGMWAIAAATGAIVVVGLLVLMPMLRGTQSPAFVPPRAQPPSSMGPSIDLVAQPGTPTQPQYSLSLHNLPGIEREAAAEVAVTVIGPAGEVAWLAPAAHPPGAPWPIPHVATLQLPDGPLLSAAPPGTKVVALFLRAGARREDVVAWAHAGASVLDEATARRHAALAARAVHVQTLFF